MAASKAPSRLDDVLSGQGQLEFDAPPNPPGPRGQPPAIKFPIGSLEGLEHALREMGWMAAAQKKFKAALDSRVSTETDAYLARLVIFVDGSPVTFKDRLEAIELEAEKFCREHRKNLLDGQGKSRELNHGTFGWRKKAAAVVALDRPGPGPGKWFDKLVALLEKVWRKLPGLPGRSAAWMSPKPAVNRTKLKEAFEKDQVTSAELKQMGFRYVPESDEFFLTASSQELDSTSTEPPGHASAEKPE